MPRRRRVYTRAEWNAIIDATLHPFSERYPFILVLDGFLHGVVEQDPRQTILKFLKYSSPKLLEHILTSGQVKKKRRSRHR